MTQNPVHSNPNSSIKVSLIQYAITDNINDNSNTLLKLIRNEMIHQPNLIVLPEIALGHPQESTDVGTIHSVNQEFLVELQKIATANHVYFYGSFTFVDSVHKCYNRALLVSPQGELQTYDKCHLFMLDGENQRFQAGQDIKTFTSPWGILAPLICFDIRFPELLRTQVQLGATLALVCAQWPQSRLEHWHTLLKARAIENQIWVVACNRTGSKKGMVYSGESVVISPWGDVVLKVMGDQIVGRTTLDPHVVDTLRAQYPFLASRRFL